MGDIPRLECHVEECPPPSLMGFEPARSADRVGRKSATLRSAEAPGRAAKAAGENAGGSGGQIPLGTPIFSHRPSRNRENFFPIRASLLSGNISSTEYPHCYSVIKRIGFLE